MQTVRVTRSEIAQVKAHVEGIRDQMRRQILDFDIVVARLDRLLDDDEPTIPGTPEAKR